VRFELAVGVTAAAVALSPLNLSAAEPTEFERYLTSVKRLVDSLEFEKALSQLTTARKYSRGLADDVTVELLEGVLYCELGKLESARRAFRAGLGLNLDAPLPVTAAPKVRRELEAIRAQMKAMALKSAPNARGEPAANAVVAPPPLPALTPATGAEVKPEWTQAPPRLHERARIG
jgi:hypothetical protein